MNVGVDERLYPPDCTAALKVYPTPDWASATVRVQRATPFASVSATVRSAYPSTLHEKITLSPGTGWPEVSRACAEAVKAEP